jgi:serine/threonine protein phosphatase PrpC
MIVHSASEKGKRPTNEDQHFALINITGDKFPHLAHINLFGVFDGHGGDKVSALLKKYLCTYILNKKNKFPLEKKTIESIYDKVQEKIVKKIGKDAVNMGSTALVVIQYVDSGHQYIQALNVGDSRLVINHNNLGNALTKDHKPGKFDEKERITNLGGKIEFDGVDFRIEDISVSRAFGDLSANTFITHRPEIVKRMLSPDDKFLILACDGLWDVLETQDAVDYVLEHMLQNKQKQLVLKDKRLNMAKSLAQYAIKKGSTDNVSVIIVFL